MSYRVVYGETRPAWEKIFPTKREADAFAKEHKSFGDIIYSVKKVVPGEPPQSLFGVNRGGARCAVVLSNTGNGASDGRNKISLCRSDHED